MSYGFHHGFGEQQKANIYKHFRRKIIWLDAKQTKEIVLDSTRQKTLRNLIQVNCTSVQI